MTGSNFDSPASIIDRLENKDIQYIEVGDHAKLVFPVDNYFVDGSPEIKRSKHSTLEYTSALLEQVSGHITITGHTDNVHNIRNLEKFTLQQAESFKAFFWAHGVELENMSADGKGDSDPVASNRTVKGSTMNRRLEITWNKAA